MVLSISNENQHNLQVGNLTFEKVDNFKYLGVNKNSKNEMHREISERIASGNRCYHSICKLLKSKLLSKKSKKLLYTSYLRPVITYACETWSSTKGDDNRLTIFEWEVLRNIFGPIYNIKLGIFGRKKNDDLYRLYLKPNISSYIKIKRMEWFGHVWRADKDIINKVLTETIHKKRLIGRLRTRWKDAVEKDIKMLGRNVTVDLALDREIWRELHVVDQVLQGPLS
jgi:hypothetical protein